MLHDESNWFYALWGLVMFLLGMVTGVAVWDGTM